MSYYSFVQSDPWWSFGMAINVFLDFLRSTNPQTFKRRIWIYCVTCYGGPLVMGILCLTIRDKDKGIVFGDATVRVPRLSWPIPPTQDAAEMIADVQTFRSTAGLTEIGTLSASTCLTYLSGSASRDPLSYMSRPAFE